MYSGQLTGYRRAQHRTELVFHTDWDTDETVHLEHPGSDDPSGAFRIEGRPFEASDWSRIESAPGMLRAGVRATAWVCEDGITPPVIDWQPAPP